MIKNYLKIAWRNLLKHKSFSLVNIFGLAIGIAACLVIFIYIRHELTFDQYNKNADRIARITATVHAPESDIVMAPTPALLAPTLQKLYPEVAAAVRLEKSKEIVRMNNEYFKEQNFYWTDQTVFTVFSFDVLEGTLTGALDKPNTIVITSRIAKKYFGNGSPIGKMMVCNNENRLVTAVIKDRPANSDIKIDALLSHDYSAVTEWMDGFSAYTFVLFTKKTNAKTFEKKLVSLSKNYVQPELDKVGSPNYKAEFLVEPLSDVHFSQGKHDDTPKGNRRYNYVFSILAIFILLIALLNYINLSTAKAAERAKEVGIRKVSGALPFQLIQQFLFESFFLITIAWLVSFLLVYFTVPFLNKLLQTTLTIQWGYALLFTGIVFAVTFLLAGLYPAFVLSSFKPVKVLKGNWRNTGKGILLRKTITVTQFAIAAALIMGATVIYNQMRFLEKKDLGYTKEQLMNIYLPRDSAYRGAVTAFVNALRQQPSIKGVTIGGGMVVDGLTIGNTFVEDKGKKREIMCNFFPVDPHFLSVFRVQLLEGRNLSDSFETDKKEALLVNEAFVKMMGWQSGIGKKIDGWGHKGKVVGVVKNFYYRSLHNLVEPLLMVYNNVPTNITTVNVSPQNLPIVKNIYKQYFPAIPIDYFFFDEIISRQYEKDRITMSLFNNFTILAIFISCLGLYGLVSLITIHRTKEIGIRKVLGASLSNLLLVLSKDFVKLVFVALIIALPVAGILMHKWLQSYAYHEPLAWWMFLIPAVVVLVVAIAVISRQVLKTAFSNPVESLKIE
ncbi:MAG: ABC transporter permease [Chitinophagaceae bacterium]|nr:ABC transporter permease [Chitinophagaceae bacterium]